MDKNLNRHFTREATQMANKYIKMSNITICQENTNENHNDIPLHTTERLKWKRPSVAGDVEQQEFS